ncbi:hypothetical protein V7111_18080 [Neobacillus niacini]|uniref:hypothetical protein n=1 Tax=Neobacillus niacini TaxID=86668 RepID=UPI0030026CD7
MVPVAESNDVGTTEPSNFATIELGLTAVLSVISKLNPLFYLVKVLFAGIGVPITGLILA